VGLPPPKRTDGERDDVTLTEWDVDDLRAVGKRLSADERTRQQHLVGIRRELQHDAWTRLVAAGAEAAAAAATPARLFARAAAGSALTALAAATAA
jgi:hypothetical protein